MTTQKPKQLKGFATMSTEKKRAVAAKGGRTAHRLGRAHRWTSEEAQEAGRRGGSISRRGPKKLSEQARARVLELLAEEDEANL